MTDLEKVRSRLAEYEGHDVTDGHPRFLFRGQSAIYQSITPTFSRIPVDETEVGQAYTVFRHAKRICQGLRGYTIDHLDGVAVLQHHGWPTPLIDLTGTADVAVFFALHGAVAGSQGVIYVVDTRQLPEQIILVDHSFLTHTLRDGALRHRWLRQDGFAVTTQCWRDAIDARAFDLLAEPFCSALEANEFTVSSVDRTDLADVLSVAGDPMPEHLQNLLRLFCDQQFEGALAPKLSRIIDEMWDGSAR